MARIYHRDQAGAPQNFSTVPATRFQLFKELLIACLVNGYGEYPGAGWELINQGNAFLVLRNQSHSGYVCFTYVGDVIRVYLAATYSGVSGNVITGEGVKSGVSSGSSIPQVIPNMQLYHANSCSWAMVADGKSFCLNMSNAGNSTSPVNLVAAVANYSTLLYVGEDSAGNFISMGGGATANTGTTAVNGRFSAADGFTSLRHPSTGALVDAGTISPYNTYGNNGSLSLINFSPTVYPVLSFSKFSWITSGNYSGYLRGVAQAPELMMFYEGGRVRACGGGSDVTTRNIFQALDLGDDYFWCSASANTSFTFSCFLTTNPEYWP